MARRRGRPWKPGDRVLVYIRVSKVGDREDTLLSDTIQEVACRRWAEREGLEIIAEPVTDLDETGREVTRRQIKHSIERIRQGEADGIVVWKISRWGRNLLDSWVNVKELQEAGGFIASTTENLEDIESAMGQFSLTQMLSLAQLQSDQIGETWQNIQDYRVSRGLPRSGKVRWGYVKNEIARDDDPSLAYSEHPLQGKWLRHAYEQFIAGRTLSSIVREMRENGVTTNTGRPMTYTSLRKVMDSGFAAGLLVDRRDVPRNGAGTPQTTNPNACLFTEGVQPALISPDLWEAYVRRRAEQRPPREAAVAHRLAGLVHCASCGRKLIVLWAKRRGPEPYRQYKCFYTKQNKNTAAYCTAPVVIRQSYVEDEVRAWLTDLANEDGSGYSRARAHQRRLEKAQADIVAVESEIESLTKLRTAYLDAKAHAVDAEERQEMDQRRAELKRQITELERRLAALQAGPRVSDVPDAEAFGALTAIWGHAEVDLVNGALRKVLQKVYVGRSPTGRGNRYSTGAGRVRVIGVWEGDPGPGAALHLVPAAAGQSS